MRLVVSHPPGRGPERRYALEVVLGEFLGLDCELVEGEDSDVWIRDPSGAGAVVVRDVFFRRWVELGTTPRLLPTLPLRSADLDASGPAAGARTVEPSLPLLFADGEGPVAERREDGATLRLDVFGSAFFSLTRLEELLVPDRDAHGRFPAASSTALRAGILQRPLVDEYVEVLWAVLSSVWPRLERRRRSFRVVPTHDVDWPLCMRKPLGGLARDVAADVVRRGDAELALRRTLSLLRTRLGGHDADLCNTFDFIMDTSERSGVASAFYFLAAGPEPGPYGYDYSLEEPWIRALLARIAARGHEVGLHGSYDGYRDRARTGRELAALTRACGSLGIRQDRLGGRQHFLRWENPTTWRAWSDAGLAYDSTLGYAESPGFRAGVCREYPVFDLEERTTLPLRERPLVVMETTLTDYLGLRGDKILEEGARLRAACRSVEGDFVLLWHNNRLVGRADRDVYRSLVTGA